MQRIFVTGLALAIAAIAPATAAAKPGKADKRNAATECRGERGSSAATREAFAARYRNFGACVRAKTAEEHAERHEARRNAARECRDERGTTAESRAAFAEKYGTNRNKRNAFGKCVSGKARSLEAAEDRRDAHERRERRNAARECRDERGTTAESRAAFAEKYGTNRNKRNAFGKCVSARAGSGGEAQDDGRSGKPEGTGRPPAGDGSQGKGRPEQA